MREWAEYLAVVFFIKVAKILPNKFIYFLFDKISILFFKILKSRRNLAINNLKMAFNIDEKKATKIALESFRSIGKTISDCLILINKKANLEDFFENPSKDIEKIKKAIQNSPNGVIFFTAHFGNWEILTQFVAKIGFPKLVIAREGNNTLIENNITFPFRHTYGNKTAYKNEAMSKMVKKLKDGGNVGLLTDLSENGISLPFFGRPAQTTKTIGLLYIKYNPKIIPIFNRRNENGKYEIIIEDFIEPKLSGKKDEDVEIITKTCNDIYEKIISQSPQQWFWMHNRWKQK